MLRHHLRLKQAHLEVGAGGSGVPSEKRENWEWKEVKHDMLNKNMNIYLTLQLPSFLIQCFTFVVLSHWRICFWFSSPMFTWWYHGVAAPGVALCHRRAPGRFAADPWAQNAEAWPIHANTPCFQPCRSLLERDLHRQAQFRQNSTHWMICLDSPVPLSVLHSWQQKPCLSWFQD